MTRRPLILSSVLLLACLATLPACKKKVTETAGGDNPAPGPTPTATVGSDYVLFAHLRAKDIRDSALFAEVKQAFVKSGASEDWDKFEADASKEIGVKPTDIESVTFCVTEIPAANVRKGGPPPRGSKGVGATGVPNDDPRYIAILTANKPIDKTTALGLGPNAKPDSRGFYAVRKEEGLIHFPDDKTLVVVHPDLAQKYLDGYAKNRAGWPMTAELTRAAAGHTLFAVAQVQKVPNDITRELPAEQFGSLLSAKTVTLTADLKGKEVVVAARATFPDAAAAGKAKETVTNGIEMAVGFIAMFENSKEAKELGSVAPAIQEAKRALKEAKVEVSGSDLLVSGRYKADFDIGTMVVEAVKKVRGAAERMTASNNLKQIVLGLHNHSSAHGQIPVHGVGAKGMVLRNPNEKMLLSWRVAMLPYMGQDNLYREFKLDEPWDSAHNTKLIEKMPKVYESVGKPGKPGHTHMQMVIGPNAMQPPSASIPASFPDGTSNTIAVVEAAEPVIWTKPADVMLSGKELPKDLKKKIGGLYPGGFNVAMWDGSVRFIRDTTSDRTLSLLLDPKDGQVLGSDW